MTANPISTVSLMLTLAGLVGSFFNIQLSQWLRDLIALEQKAVLNKFQGTDTEKRAIVECKIEYKKLTNTSTYALNLLIIGFVVFVLGDALLMACRAQEDPLYPNVVTALWVFLAFFLFVSGWLIYACAQTAKRAQKAISAIPRADRKSARATQIDVAALRKFGQRLFANIVARERGYALRKYQINAAIEAVSLASVGKNSAIELPTGTGKTLIACLAATYWKRLQPHARVLLVVPSRTLVVQHFDVAHWIMPELVVDSLDDDQSGKPGSLRATLLRADFLITTPGILAGALERKLVDRSYVASIQFVIADEFDTFVVSDEADRYTESRFAQNWSRLKAQLTPKTRFLVKSATLI